MRKNTWAFDPTQKLMQPYDPSALPQDPNPMAYQRLGMLNQSSGNVLGVDSSDPQAEEQKRLRGMMQGAPLEKGRKESVSDTDTTNFKHSSQKTNIMDPEESQRLIMQEKGIYPRAKLDENGEPLTDNQGNIIYDNANTFTDPEHPYQQQSKSIDQMQNLLAMQADENGKKNLTDYSPLMKLADYEAAKRGQKSDLEQGYKAPESGATQTLANSMGLLKARADLNKEALVNSKVQKSGMSTDMLNQISVLKNLAEAGLSPNNRSAVSQENAFLSRVTRDSRDMRTQDQVLTNVSKLLAQGNPSSDREIKTQIARLVEGTVRPQLAVIGASGGDTSIMQSLLNTLERAESGKLTPEQRGQYRQELEALAGTHAQAANALKASWAVQNQRLENPFKDEELGKIMGAATPGAGTSAVALRKVAPAKNPGLVPTGDTVRVVDPYGKYGTIPKGNLQKAISKGYKKVGP